MAGLTDTNISTSYTSLLRVNDNTTGVDGTLEHITDGEGNATPLDISTTKFRVYPSGNAVDTFNVTNAAGETVLLVDTTNTRLGVNGTPSNTLHVSHTAADGNNGIMIVNEASTIADTNLLGGIGFDGGDGNIPNSVLKASAFIAAYAAEDHDASDKGADLVFGCSKINDDDDTVSHEYMRILDSGKVGIGTSTPTSALLHINNDTNLTTSVGDAQEFLRLEGNSNHGDRLLTSMIRLSSTNNTEWKSAQWRIQRYVDSTYMSWIGFGEVGDGSDNTNKGLAFGTGADTSEPENVSTRMVIDLNGNVGIGTTAPSAELEVRGPAGTGFNSAGELRLSTAETSIGSGDLLGLVSFSAPIESDGTDSILPAAAIGCVANAAFDGNQNEGELTFYTAGSETALASGQERMRITYDGKVGVGTSTPSYMFHAEDTQNSSYVGMFKNASTNTDADCLRLIISTANGDATNNNRWLTCEDASVAEYILRGDGTGGIEVYDASDRRLKENIIDIPDSLTMINNLKPRRYNRIGVNSSKYKYGFIADEFASVFPNSVAGTSDGPDYQSISTKNLLGVLTKAVQELSAKVTALENA